MKKSPLFTVNILFTFLSLASFSCGVKGVPLPPVDPIQLGRGEISKPREVKPSQKLKKYQYNKSDEKEEFFSEED